MSQLINARYGMNVAAYMNFWRARTAARLLVESPEKPIKIVMHEAGFRSKSIFNREFQRHFAKSPGEYREAGAGARAMEHRDTKHIDRSPPHGQ